MKIAYVIASKGKDIYSTTARISITSARMMHQQKVTN
jgi:hypothetical protein